jgi:hypothetical protein
VRTDADAKPAAVVVSIERCTALLHELEALRRGN